MRRVPHLTALPGAVLALGLLAGAGRAQPVTPYRVPGYMTPPVSPYINLLRGGNPTYLNYYGLVRPQVQFQNSVVGLQQEVTTLGTGTGAQAGPTGLPETGHAVSFVNYSHYYASPLGRPGGGASLGVGAAAAAARPGGGAMAGAAARPTMPGGGTAAPRTPRR
jgi:hypothetical protein